MGNTSSAPTLTQEQEDLKFLGDRVPFGDEELAILYNAYQLFQQMESRQTFLYDWSSCIGGSKIREIREKLLPENFGNALYQANFVPGGDVELYDNSSSTERESSQLVDEYTRKSRLQHFFEGLANCSRRGSKESVTVLFRTQANIENSTDDRVSSLSLVDMGYRIALTTCQFEEQVAIEPSENKLESLARSIADKGRYRRQRSGQFGECPYLEAGRVELRDVQEWAEDVVPMFGYILPTFFQRILFPDQAVPRGRTLFEFPFLNDASSFFDAWSSLLFSLSCLSNNLTGQYHRLYNSDHDGLSFNRLQAAVLGYGGPTVFIIRSTNNGIFGAFTASPWKESKDFYGNTDCFLFVLSPQLAVYRPTGSAQCFMYNNSMARSHGYDQQAHGIGFGGDVQEPRLFLAENFDDNVARPRDLTFENGKLLPTADHRFDIENLEVWGVGGTELVKIALDSREASRKVKEEAIRRARKVDKAQFLDDFQAGTFESKAFAHRGQIDGRGQADVEDHALDKDKVYEYAK